MIVLDCSVVIAWACHELSPYANAVRERLETLPAVVPSLWPIEVGNVLWVAERRKRITGRDASNFLEELSELSIEVDPGGAMTDLPILWTLAREYGLSVYDAAYLELAIRKEARLATLDEDLRKAAKKAGVEWVG